VIRESLTNCAKHANATEVSIHISVLDGRLICNVSDNGVGYQENSYMSGIANMESRAASCNGEFTIESTLSGGTNLMWSATL
jgi:signal transduction histidine kinase